MSFNIAEETSKFFKKNYLTILICFFGCIFVFSVYMLISHFAESKSDIDYNENMANEVVSIITPTSDGEKEIPVDTCPVSVNFSRLSVDAVGWLYSPNSPINYVVAQSKDNEKYLHHRLDGSENAAGTLFMDYRNSKDFSDLNTFIYGHSMKNGTMFGMLAHYKNKGYYEEHPFMWIVTPEGAKKLKIIAGFTTPADSESYNFFATEEDLRAYVAKALEKSDFKSGFDSADTERIVTLSTCAYNYENARYVLLGVILE